LAESELIRDVGDPGTYYEITWRGKAYLEGELELEVDEE